MSGEVFIYEALYNYSDDSLEDHVTINPGDQLEVEGPLPPSPDTWLYGFNTSTGVKGFFPGNFVTFVKKKEAVETEPQPPLPGM